MYDKFKEIFRDFQKNIFIRVVHLLRTLNCDARLPRSGGIPYIFKACEKKSLCGICPSIWHHRLETQRQRYENPCIIFFCILKVFFDGQGKIWKSLEESENFSLRFSGHPDQGKFCSFLYLHFRSSNLRYDGSIIGNWQWWKEKLVAMSF